MVDEETTVEDEAGRALEEAMAARPTPRMPQAEHREEPRTQQPTGYEHLNRILGAAYHQAFSGKGRERHAIGFTGFRPWDKQPILELSRITGPGASAYQVMKKIQEACTMTERKNFAGAKAEALGAIVYAAALVKLIEEIEHGTS